VESSIALFLENYYQPIVTLLFSTKTLYIAGYMTILSICSAVLFGDHWQKEHIMM
jgi:hypothetical protein